MTDKLANILTVALAFAAIISPSITAIINNRYHTYCWKITRRIDPRYQERARRTKLDTAINQIRIAYTLYQVFSGSNFFIVGIPTITATVRMKIPPTTVASIYFTSCFSGSLAAGAG